MRYALLLTLLACTVTAGAETADEIVVGLGALLLLAAAL